MANSYTQIHIHFVFAVKYREALIEDSWKKELHKYITGIFKHNQHKILQINSMPDHIHIFSGLRPHQSISSLIQNVKSKSTQWIRDKEFCTKPFSWQEGYGAFSYSLSQINHVATYIENQEEHHKTKTFKEEYIQFLQLFNVDFKNEYVFEEA